MHEELEARRWRAALRMVARRDQLEAVREELGVELDRLCSTRRSSPSTVNTWPPR